MQNILLVYAAGMSTSILVKHMQRRTENIKARVNINALAISKARGKIKNNEVDVILLGPQARFQEKEVEEVAQGKIPVAVINMKYYGQIDNKAVLESALALLANQQFPHLSPLSCGYFRYCPGLLRLKNTMTLINYYEQGFVMSFMDTFERGMEKILVPVAIKLSSQIHVSAIHDVFILSLPIVMASSLIILISFAILSPDRFIVGTLHLGAIFSHLAEVQQVLTPVTNDSANIMTVLITFLVARNMAIGYQQDDSLCGLTAIGAFFVVYTPYIIIDDQAYLATKYLGPQRLFVAIIVALISSRVFYCLARNPRVTITMPTAVPPVVARSFKVLSPTFFVMIFFSILNYLLARIPPNGLNDLIYTLIQVPLKNMRTNVVTVLMLGPMANLLWVPGVYGSNTVAAIRKTIFSEADLENLSYAASHGSTWGAPYPITWTGISDAFANYSGSGMTLGLLSAIFIALQHNDYRDLAKMAFMPGPFNISEPVVFGLPIVLNPILVIPFILAPFVNSLVGYFFISMEFVPPIAYAVPWATPGPLIAFLGTGGDRLALFVGILRPVVSALIYLPFVIAANRIDTAAAADQRDGDVCR